MVKCKECEQEMNDADGCKYPYIKLQGKWYKRSTESWNDERCGDCGAKVGHVHHFECDVERCPKCGGQLISCDCIMSIKGKKIEGSCDECGHELEEIEVEFCEDPKNEQ